MTDDDLLTYWPALGIVAVELRRIGHPAAASQLLNAVRSGATSGEILGEVGQVLRAHFALRKTLDGPTRLVWDSIVSDARKAFP